MTSTTTTLTDSISSLSSSSPSRAPSISRIYKQASQLFLTRQLAEAWEILTPLVHPGGSSHTSQSSDGGYSLDTGSSNCDETNGYQHTNGIGPNAFHNDPTHPEPRSPIATASKSARVKVWGLWLALVNELLKLGPEDGGAVMRELDSHSTRQGNKSGSKRWREIACKVQEGAIWEDVVKVGYEGDEGKVDGEVVANLATLLLSHSPTQTLTQSRLETYLSTTNSGPSPSELATKLGDSTHAPTSASTSAPHIHPTHSHRPHASQHGTSTPADLNTRLKLLEIYTLHVLPRNEEWDYARDFISLSEVLDDDRREAFLAALGGLREESELQSKREGELLKRRQMEAAEMAKRKEVEEKRRTEEEEQNRRLAGEMGLGKRREREREREDANGSSAKPIPASTSSGPKQTSAPAPGEKRNPPKSSAAPSKRPSPRNNAGSDNFLHRASHTLAALQRAVLQMGSSLMSNPMMILRFLLFIVAMVIALGRRDVRERVGRAWEKVRGTIGMGVKTTYL